MKSPDVYSVRLPRMSQYLGESISVKESVGQPLPSRDVDVLGKAV